MAGIRNLYQLPAVPFVILLAVLLLAVSAPAQDTQELKKETEQIKQQLKQLQEQMQRLQKQLQDTEEKLQETKKEQEWNTEDVKDLSDRVAKTERHTAADKVELSVSLEPRLWSIHMQDVRTSFPVLQSAFPRLLEIQEASGTGFSKQNVQGLLSGQFPLSALQNPPFNFDPAVAEQLAGLDNPPTADVDNHAVRTLRFRLRMDAELNKNLRFAGRLAAYKVFGDSVGINFNKGGFQDISFDGTTASNPHGNEIRLERAYFIYQNQFKNMPWSISLGRRPSTEGPPLQFKKNFPVVGGSPHAHLINWEFDGGSLNLNLEEVVGIPGFDIKFCYGSGFENQYGTTSAFLAEPEVEDVDFYGVIGTLYENYLPDIDTDLKLSYNYAFAPNITDGFTGLTVFPFNVTKNPDNTFSFESNDFLAVSRFEPASKIGDWHALSFLTEATMLEGNLNLFLSGAWSHTKAEEVSEIPLFEMLGYGLLSSGDDLEDHDGWSIYTGGRYTVADWGTKLGLEYNYGSKYWFNVTGAEDNLIGPKLATRGHVLEPYLIQQIIGDNFFVRLGAQLYWFEYSGSGFPLGKPVDVDDVTGLDSIFPVIDEMQQYYLSVVARF